MGRLGGASVLLAGFLALLFFSACRTTVPSSVDISKAPQAETGNVHITKIAYSAVEGGTSIKIYGTGRLEYTSYKLSEPFRLAVEIPDVILDFEPKHIEMDDADISSLSVVRFPKINSVRIEMGLFSNVPFVVNSSDRYLEIVVAHESGKKPDELAALTDIDAYTATDEVASLEENEKLKLENLQSRQETQELLKENMLLEQRLEETLAQLEKSAGMAKAMKARTEFMEKKLSELRRRISGKSPKADLKTATSLPSPAMMEIKIEKETLENANADSRQAIEEIRKMLNSWLTAWNRKEFPKYSAFYSSDFNKGSMNHAEWLEGKREKFAMPGAIEVKLKKVKIKLPESQNIQNAIAIFEQFFESPLYRDKGVKTLKLVKNRAGWQIISESWKTL